MEELKIKAPAKINIGLNVISKRPDGYHNIETIFYPLELCDYLTIEQANNFEFTSNNIGLSSAFDNLIIKAKEKLEEKTGKKINVHIHLDKNIPIGGGLGGGSSDAASTLTGLNEFLNLNLSDEKLFEIALSLGSDVPFFLNPKPCFAESRGEKLIYINFSINHPILIVNPDIHISTKWAYEHLAPQEYKPNLKEIMPEHFKNIKLFKDKIKNDFEKVVFPEYKQVGELKDELYKNGALFALMSGSGSTVFGIFKDNHTANKVKKIFDNAYFTFIQNYN